MSTGEEKQKEPFVSRWSRRKQEARAQPPQEAPKQADPKPLPELPPIDTLSFESDFRGFMDSRVDEVVRRIALKKLFSDPRFNVTDGLDDYAEDYAALEDLSAAMVDKLQHARRTLRGPEPEESEAQETQTAAEQFEQTAESAEQMQARADVESPEEDSTDRKGADETEQRSG